MINIKEICEANSVDSDGAVLFNTNWIISAGGDMIGGPAERYFYGIWDYRLEEPDWIAHLMEKNWFDIHTFMPAYVEALMRYGVSQLECRYVYGGKLHNIKPSGLAANKEMMDSVINEIIYENSPEYMYK